MNYTKAMLNLQEDFNKKVHPEWDEQNYDWVNAIVLESSEAIDSLAHKWWKSGKNDWSNFNVELIDLWHFIMSAGMSVWSKGYLTNKYENLYEDVIQEYYVNNEVNVDIEDDKKYFSIHYSQVLMKNALNFKFSTTVEEREECYNNMVMSLFTLLFTIHELDTLEDVYSYYITKNVLNKFRQDFGYKEGTYIKNWNGEEDNVVAFNLVYNNPEVNFDDLYAELETIYKKVS